MKGYKGFNEDFTCARNKQYKENTIFEEPKARLCEIGMHYCPNPLDVLLYYPIMKEDCKASKYANVIDLDFTEAINKSACKKCAYYEYCYI